MTWDSIELESSYDGVFAFSTGANIYSLNCSLFSCGECFDVFSLSINIHISPSGVNRAFKPLMPN